MVLVLLVVLWWLFFFHLDSLTNVFAYIGTGCLWGFFSTILSALSFMSYPTIGGGAHL